MFRIFGNKNCVIMGNGNFVQTSSGNTCGEKRTFDETKVEKADDIDSIYIDSASANVTVMEKDTSDITVHFSGSATIMSGDVNYKAYINKRELTIKFNVDGCISNSDLKINITVPSEKKFEYITFTSQSSDLEILGTLLTKNFLAQTMSGDISGEVNFHIANVKTMSGDVDLETHAEEYINVKLSTMSGDILLNLHNVGETMLNYNTMSGSFKNQHRESTDGYTAKIDVSTMSGNIKIK